MTDQKFHVCGECVYFHKDECFRSNERTYGRLSADRACTFFMFPEAFHNVQEHSVFVSRQQAIERAQILEAQAHGANGQQLVSPANIAMAPMGIFRRKK